MAINRLLFQYRGNCCACCGKAVEQMLKRYGVANKLFQFHHIDPDKKHPDYNKLMQRKLSAEHNSERGQTQKGDMFNIDSRKSRKPVSYNCRYSSCPLVCSF